MEIYGQMDPPIYDIKRIDIPIATYWSYNDWLAQPTVSNMLLRYKILYKLALV